jgi:hypothetical protein
MFNFVLQFFKVVFNDSRPADLHSQTQQQWKYSKLSFHNMIFPKIQLLSKSKNLAT